MTVRVLLVDDDALVRAGLRMILAAVEDLQVVGEADDGARAVAAVREHRPDVVLMDIRMPEMDGIAATAALRRLDIPTKVIVLTTFQADEQVMSALRAVIGVLRDESGQESAPAAPQPTLSDIPRLVEETRRRARRSTSRCGWTIRRPRPARWDAMPTASCRRR